MISGAEAPKSSPSLARWLWSLDPVAFAESLGIEPDPWQAEVLRSKDKRLILNCTRQGGKSTVVAILALHVALNKPDSLILLISPSGRQSAELFDKIYKLFCRVPDRPKLTTDNVLSMELPNRSRIIALPDSEDKIRGYSSVDLIVEDEASRVPDELHNAVQPMLIVSGGRYIELSTPKGKKGHFYKHWTEEGNGYRKIQITIDEIPRITEAQKEDLKRAIGSRSYAQECLCQFLDVIGAGTIHREWFEFVNDWPHDAPNVRYWDLAATEGGGDWTAGARMAEQDGIFYIVDVQHAQLTAGSVEALVKVTAELDKVTTSIAIEQEPGSSGKGTVDHYARHVLKGYIFKGVLSSGAKEERIKPFAAAAEAHNVKLVRAGWNESLLEELVAFPTKGVHDDQVDACSGAFNMLNDRPVAEEGIPIDRSVGGTRAYDPFNQAQPRWGRR